MLLNDAVDVWHFMVQIEPFDLIVSGIFVESVFIGFYLLSVNLRIVSNHDRNDVNKLPQLFEMKDVLYTESCLCIDEVEAEMYSGVS